MYYPLMLLESSTSVSPLFGTQIKGSPYIFDLSSNNSQVMEYNLHDYDSFQERIFSEMGNSTWGIGKYLEERKSILRDFPQMIQEKRYFHAGLDIVVPEGFTLYAPIESTVFELGMDAGSGNYGGYVVLGHKQFGEVFYSIYGHLDTRFPVSKGDRLKPGDLFAKIGAREDSGGWFSHTHLQILTQKAIDQGRMLHGYATAADLEEIESLFPTPYPLFRY